MELEQDHKVREYLDAVCAQVKCREMHGQIRQELLGHLEEAAAESLRLGAPETEAVARAVGKMGDASALGRQLHRAHRPRTEWSVILLVGLCLGFGLLILYSIVSGGWWDNSYGAIFVNSLMALGFGLLAAAGAFYFDYRKIRPYSKLLYLGTLILWLIVLHFGPKVSGKPMLFIGRIPLDFIAISPYLFAVALAGLFAGWNWERPGAFLKTAVLIIAPCWLYFVDYGCPDVASGIIFVFLFLCLLLASGAGLKRLLLMSGLAIGLFLFALLYGGAPYRFLRLISFLHPYSDPQGSGYLNVQILEAVRAAGLWGRGFTFPLQTLPDIHADFIFTFIIFTFGWIFGLAALAMVLCLITRMARVAGQTKDRYGQLLATGLTAVFAVQFCWNILMAIGLAPIINLPLPFLSYVGAQSVVQMAATGLVLSVYRRKDMIAEYGEGDSCNCGFVYLKDFGKKVIQKLFSIVLYV